MSDLDQIAAELAEKIWNIKRCEKSELVAIIKAAIEKAWEEGYQSRLRAVSCPQCGAKFTPRSHNQKFCSHKCRYAAKASK